MLNNLIDRIKLPFRKDKELYSSLYQIIGFYPHDISLYKLALMHKSMFRRNEKGRPVNNERLEFLGDAVLDAAAGDIVYRHFPGKREGFLTNTRSKLVQRETLNRLAEEMGLTRLILSNNRNQSHNSYMGGNAFEALVGAIYLDRGYNACMRFMQRRILKEMINLDKVAYKEVNFKSKLIEWGQKNRVDIQFVVLEEEKDKNGSPFFKYRVDIEGIEGGTGTGYSKKESQQQASKLTLQRLRREPQFIDSVFAAKTNRTKMEEEPVLNVPDPEAEQRQSFIVSHAEESHSAAASRTQKPADTAEAEPKKQRRRSPMYAKADDQKAKTDAPKSKTERPAKAKADDQKAATAEPKRKTERAVKAKQPAAKATADDELSFDDIDTGREKTREEIIAAAEAAAFAES